MSESQAATKYIIELRKEIKQIREENERLRELVEVIYECGDISPNLWDRIVKEVGDE